jgi:membrane-associated phospholipid phosphatase
VTAAVAVIGSRYLPRGWGDLARQIGIWIGFLLAYQVARGLADLNPTRAFENGLTIVAIEEHMGRLFELSFQHLIESSRVLTAAVSWTYWNSEFTVVGLTLLWVYLRRHDQFRRFRNWILLSNGLGLVGYVALPTAPPRMFGNFGFTDTLAQFGALNHGSGLVELAANPYAAMPSLHFADAVIVGITLTAIVKRRWAKALWVFWPVWVGFSVIATGNHFWLDCVAGILVALLALGILNRKRLRQRFRPAPAA